jgi:glycosyltransferase involved in cell wall biosynthesis
MASYTSLTSQTLSPDEIIVVIDHNQALLERFQQQFPEAVVLPNTGPDGLSGARNTGVQASSADVILFLDGGTAAGPRWVEVILAPFENPTVQGVAGWANPNWDEPGRPSWFPEQFLWVVGCSYEGLPTVQADIRNPLSCAMGFRRSAWELTGGFSSRVGRIGFHPGGAEETEFSIRLRQLEPSTRIVLVPEAVVLHRVFVERLTRSYYLRRCYWEGVSKAIVSAGVGSKDALESERSYTTRVLPRAFMTGLLDTVRGDLGGIQRSAAVFTGLFATTAGYVRGRLAGRRNVEPIAPSGPSLRRVGGTAAQYETEPTDIRCAA